MEITFDKYRSLTFSNCTGTENRETPIRLCHAASPRARNFEIRSVDGLMNPHLAMAAIFGAGTIALKAKAQLSMKDCGDVAAAILNDGEREKLGIVQRMSLTWEEARDRLQKSDAMKEIFGSEMLEKYLSTNKVSFDPLQCFPTFTDL